MSERTPSLSTIRYAWAKAHPFSLTTDVEERYAEFDRAIAAHDAEKRAEREAEQGAEVEYRVFDREGELWASTNSLDEARHYLAQDPSGFARIERAVWVPVEQEGENGDA